MLSGALVGLSTLGAGSPAGAAGILPPGNPSVNLPLDVAAVQACLQPGGAQSATCENEALSQIDHARAQEGIGPMSLPGDYLSLTPAEQLLVVLSAERAARGLSAPAGLVAAFDQGAQQGANRAQDPPAPGGYAVYGSLESEGLDTVLLADYEWMYDDGFGSYNADCTSPSASGCWVHRDIILGGYSATPYFYMGAASAQSGSTIYTALFVDSLKPQAVAYAMQPTSVSPALSKGISLTRLAGNNRDLTSVAASQNSFPSSGSARAVVLATDANYPDALAGTPLAVARHAPVLLTPPASLDPAVATEIQRVLARGSTVYILGGSAAVSQTVTSQVEALGYVVTREAGPDRFATALAIANALGHPSTVFEADGTTFQDALLAGPAAASAHGAILLTNGASMPAGTAAYLSAHPGFHYAVGAAAQGADPAATRVGGADAFATSVAVAHTFFAPSKVAGFASEVAYPDELSGSAHIGARGGPMILVPAGSALPASISSYLAASTITSGYVYGGSSAVASTVQAAIAGS